MQKIQRIPIKSPSLPRSAVLPYSSSTASPSAAPVAATYQSQNSVSPSSASVAASLLPLIPSTRLLPHQRSHYSSISQAGLLTCSLGPIVLLEVRVSQLAIVRVVQACRGRLRRVRAGLRFRVGFQRAG